MPELHYPMIFFLLLMAVAFLYASVGHGGASGYLALMALYGFSTEYMKPAALVTNIFVAGAAFILFWRAGFFRWKLFFPFALVSLPASFAGGIFSVDAQVYKYILGVILIFPILNLSGVFHFNNETKVLQPKFFLSLFIGALIGFLSGMIGIGGGIILSPVILLLRWATVKEAAAVSALFIFSNSISGLAGQISSGATLNSSSYLIMIVALAGGIAGSWFGAGKFNVPVLKKLLAAVLVIAVVKLFMT